MFDSGFSNFDVNVVVGQEPILRNNCSSLNPNNTAMLNLEHLVGIDFGSKLAGTTVICSFFKGRLHFDASKIREDADAFLLNKVGILKPDFVFIDAPLSLPGRYTGRNDCQDYFFREADIEMGAMSPMFIGGLTSRAIKMKDNLEKRGVKVFETYPTYEAKLIGLSDQMYKRDDRHIESLAAQLGESTGLAIPQNTISDWHHFDALLAFVAGMRFLRGQHRAIGKEDEGLIYV